METNLYQKGPAVSCFVECELKKGCLIINVDLEEKPKIKTKTQIDMNARTENLVTIINKRKPKERGRVENKKFRNNFVKEKQF